MEEPESPDTVSPSAPARTRRDRAGRALPSLCAAGRKKRLPQPFRPAVLRGHHPPGALLLLSDHQAVFAGHLHGPGALFHRPAPVPGLVPGCWGSGRPWPRAITCLLLLLVILIPLFSLMSIIATQALEFSSQVTKGMQGGHLWPWIAAKIEAFKSLPGPPGSAVAAGGD